MVPISYQLYSSRKFGLEDTLAMLSGLGIEAVEGYESLFTDPEAMRALLDANQLIMPTAHIGIELVQDDPARCLKIAKTLGIESVILPFLTPEQRPVDADGWQKLGKRLSGIGKPVRDAGLGFGWHNHDFEFTPCQDGALPIECLMEACPEIELELDLAWVHVAGKDPVSWIEKFSGRILAAHIKDRAAKGDNPEEDGWADVGYGVMDWVRIAAALNAAQVPRYILEHDNPSDHERFARRSLASVMQFQRPYET